MPTHDSAVAIEVDGQHIAGTLVAPATAVPGVLFVHGWGGSQEQYLARAREVAALGCVCLTFDLRGHARTEPQHETVTREHSLRDVIAAYDVLADQRAVDGSAIAVVGSSYGGYLAAILSSLRPVRWLALRAPALYKDEDWTLPKRRLNSDQLAAYRRGPVDAASNRALRACAAFEGDVLIVASEHDDVVPHPVIANYLAAFERARSITYHVIEGADHGLSEEPWQQAYTSLLVGWATEMVLRAREGGPASEELASLVGSRPGPREPGEEVLDEAIRPNSATLPK
jgi:pimeloyl-ACP methyl ester carboxylesterase